LEFTYINLIYATERDMENPTITEVLKNIIQYANRANARESQTMDVDVQDSGLDAQLDDLISQFEGRIRKQQDDLETVR
jgi:hypothetical protein